jgi:hypothetical protein
MIPITYVGEEEYLSKLIRLIESRNGEEQEIEET